MNAEFMWRSSSRPAGSVIAAIVLVLGCSQAVEAVTFAPGTVTPSPTSVVAGSTVSPLTLTYTNNSASNFTGTARITWPGGWTVPQSTQSSNPGYVVVSSSSCSISSIIGIKSGVVSIGAQCDPTQSFMVMYTGTVSTVAGTAKFKTMLQALSSSTSAPIQLQPAVKIAPASLDHLVLSSASGTAAAGIAVVYKAMGADAYGNLTGNVTKATKFTITPDGSCAQSSCRGTHPGAHTVLGVNGTATGSASLSVTTGALDHLVLTPGSATTSSGQPVAFAAEGFDAFGNDLSDATGATTFTVTPDGNCAAASCSATGLGAHTVHGADGTAAGSAALNVVAGPVISSFGASPQTITDGAGSTLSATFSGGSGLITDDKGDGLRIVATSGASIVVRPAPDVTTTYSLTVTGAGGASVFATATVKTLAAPTIQAFSATPSVITAGGSTALTATFQGGPGVINPGNIPITSDASVSVSPMVNTSFTLTVANAELGASAQSSASVTVVPVPFITSFQATPSTVTIGSTVKLTATYTGSDTLVTNSADSARWQLTVSGGSGTSLTGTVTVTPTSAGTINYLLAVTNAAGSTTFASLLISVVPAPTIISFAASQSVVSNGHGVSEQAVFTNGTARISGTNGTVTIELISSPATVTELPAYNLTTTYTLTVDNGAGSTVLVSLNVTAVAAPIIYSFSAIPSSISNGSTSTLNGSCSPGSIAQVTDTLDSIHFSIDCQGQGNLFQVDVSPAANNTTTYILVVTNQASTVAIAATSVTSS